MQLEVSSFALITKNDQVETTPNQ